MMIIMMMLVAYAYPGSVHYTSPEGDQVVVTAVDTGHIEAFIVLKAVIWAVQEDNRL